MKLRFPHRSNLRRLIGSVALATFAFPALAPLRAADVEIPDAPVSASAADQPTRPPALPPAKEAIPKGQMVHVLSGNSTLKRHESAENMVTIRGNATVDGRVRENSVTIFGNVTVNGTVEENLVCVFGDVTLGPGARIRGALVSVGGILRADPDAEIHGELVDLPFLPTSGRLGDWLKDVFTYGRVLPAKYDWAWAIAGGLILLNLLLGAMLRQPVAACGRALERRPILCFVNGGFVLLLFAPLLILLVISFVGILLVPFAVAAFTLLAALGMLGVYTLCGAQFGLQHRPLPALLVGSIAFTLLYAVPVIGLAVWSVTFVAGVGAAMTAMGRNMRNESRPAPAAIPVPYPYVPAPASVVSTPPPAAAAPTAPVANPPIKQGPPLPWFAAAPVRSASAETSLPSSSSGENPAPAAAGFVARNPFQGGASASASGASSAPPNPAPPPPNPPHYRAAPAAGSLAGLPAADTMTRVGFWPRLGAMALDLLFLLMLTFMTEATFPFRFMFRHIEPPTVLLTLALAYHILFWCWKATTPGGIVLNLRVERLDGKRITPEIAAVRALATIFSVGAAGLGLIWASIDDERQSWHDKIAGTTVVRVPRGTPLV